MNRSIGDVIAIYTRSIDALNSIDPYEDSTEEYFYNDIISASISPFQDAIIYNGQEIWYRVQRISFRFFNGDDIYLGAYLSAKPIDRRPGAPSFSLLNNRNNQTLTALRQLLRFNRPGGSRRD